MEKGDSLNKQFHLLWKTVKIQIGHRRVLSNADIHSDGYSVYSLSDNFPSTASWPRRENRITKGILALFNYLVYSICVL